MNQYIKQSLYLLDTKAKKAIPFLILSFILSSLLDVFGIGLVGVFLALLTNPLYFTHKFPWLLSLTQGLSEKKTIEWAGVLILVAFFTKAVLSLMIQNRMVVFGQTLSVRLKSRMMAAFQSAPYIYHLEKNSAHLLSRIQDNINAYINNILTPSLNFVSNAIIAFAILSFLLVTNPFSTLLLITMFATLGFGYDLLTKRKLLAMGQIAAVTNGEIIKSIHHGLHGLNEVRVLGREAYFLKGLHRYAQQYAKAYGMTVSLQQMPRYLVENAMAIFIVGVCVGGIVFGANVSSVMALVGMFAAAGARLLPTVTQMMTALNNIRGSYHHMHLVYDELSELDQMQQTQQSQLGLAQQNKLPFTKIQLVDVCYRYPRASHSALDHVNIEINKGQSIGLIGTSGSGKSTSVNVILGFLEPQAGQLLVDGQPVMQMRAWLNNFAYIPQTIFLLDDTLRRNIALGVDDADIEDEKVWDAIRMAQLMDVAQQLSQGLDTFIGENGIRLSGGQRQRVALARAFYHERDIIVMDEATSSLDHETESEVINTIKRLKGNKTLIVIAHRLTTVEHCDILYKLNKGCVITKGSYQEVVLNA